MPGIVVPRPTRNRHGCGWRPCCKLIQRGIGDIVAPSCRGMVWEGYSVRRPQGKQEHGKALAALRAAFPAGDANLDLGAVAHAGTVRR